MNSISANWKQKYRLSFEHYLILCLNLLQVCQKTPEIRDTNHLFLELPLLKEKLEEYINYMSVAGSWSQNAIQATYAWLKEGLKPRCITRDLKWGVPVPHEKFRDKVSMYICCSVFDFDLCSWPSHFDFSTKIYNFLADP